MRSDPTPPNFACHFLSVITLKISPRARPFCLFSIVLLFFIWFYDLIEPDEGLLRSIALPPANQSIHSSIHSCHQSIDRSFLFIYRNCRRCCWVSAFWLSVDGLNQTRNGQKRSQSRWSHCRSFCCFLTSYLPAFFPFPLPSLLFIRPVIQRLPISDLSSHLRSPFWQKRPSHSVIHARTHTQRALCQQERTKYAHEFSRRLTARTEGPIIIRSNHTHRRSISWWWPQNDFRRSQKVERKSARFVDKMASDHLSQSNLDGESLFEGERWNHVHLLLGEREDGGVGCGQGTLGQVNWKSSEPISDCVGRLLVFFWWSEIEQKLNGRKLSEMVTWLSIEWKKVSRKTMKKTKTSPIWHQNVRLSDECQPQINQFRLLLGLPMTNREAVTNSMPINFHSFPIEKVTKTFSRKCFWTTNSLKKN